MTASELPVPEDPEHPVIDGKVVRLVRPTSYSVDLDADDERDDEDRPPAPVPVHTGSGVALPNAALRKPIIPSHLDTWPKVQAHAAGLLADARYHVLFQGVRIPWYAWDTTRWAAVGACKICATQYRWWWQPQAAPILSQAVIDLNGPEYRRHDSHTSKLRIRRGILLGSEAAVTITGAALWWYCCPWWAETLTTVAAAVTLARFGRPRDRTMFTRALVTPRVRKINTDTVIRAYTRAGLCNPEKPGMELAFPGVMTRDAANLGSRVPISLPYGVTFEAARKALPAIASGLDVKLNQVYLHEDDESERSHILHVLDRDPLRTPAGPTPLLDLKPRNIWHAAPIGLDQFGQLVELCLMWTSILIGAQPRKGKTFSARHWALFAALDPYVKLVIIDGKSSPDWAMFKKVAHRFIAGSRPSRRDNPIARLNAVLDEIIDHIEDVNDFLGTLDTTECPEGKLTEELSRKYEQCRVWFIAADEFQVYFELDDQTVSKTLAAKFSDIKARGPSVGVIMADSTQKPAGVGFGDVNRLFNRFRDNHDIRFSLRTGSRDVSNAVLGAGADSEGHDSSKLPLGKRGKGVGILYGAVDEPPTVRCYLANGEDATTITDAARVYREQTGTITGDAAGDEFKVIRRDVLADVDAVFGDEDALQWGELAERLSERFGDRWAGVTADAVSAQVRDLGVPASQVKRSGVNKQGCKRAEVRAARNMLMPA